MNYHTALDVSLRSVSICIVDDDGAIQFEAKVPSEVDQIVACLRRFDSELQSVGFEAGALTQYLTYGLQAAGYEVICLEARQERDPQRRQPETATVKRGLDSDARLKERHS